MACWDKHDSRVETNEIGDACIMMCFLSREELGRKKNRSSELFHSPVSCRSGGLLRMQFLAVTHTLCHRFL